uniref:Rab-GAP TBC domain-containing protein n=1 Tax=Plectus sambesii TaxID=2011161 RepID=A0A914WGV7_9BILA
MAPLSQGPIYCDADVHEGEGRPCTVGRQATVRPACCVPAFGASSLLSVPVCPAMRPPVRADALSLIVTNRCSSVSTARIRRYLCLLVGHTSIEGIGARSAGRYGHIQRAPTGREFSLSGARDGRLGVKRKRDDRRPLLSESAVFRQRRSASAESVRRRVVVRRKVCAVHAARRQVLADGEQRKLRPTNRPTLGGAASPLNTVAVGLYGFEKKDARASIDGDTVVGGSRRAASSPTRRTAGTSVGRVDVEPVMAAVAQRQTSDFGGDTDCETQPPSDCDRSVLDHPSGIPTPAASVLQKMEELNKINEQDTRSVASKKSSSSGSGGPRAPDSPSSSKSRQNSVQPDEADEDLDLWAVWGSLVKNWQVEYKKRPSYIKDMVKQGIPCHFRTIAWQLLSGADVAAIHDAYAIHMRTSSPHEKVIVRDISRTYPELEFFKDSGRGQQSLFNVIKAYSLHDAEVGYCQGGMKRLVLRAVFLAAHPVAFPADRLLPQRLARG